MCKTISTTNTYTDCSQAAILGWTDGQTHTEGYKTHTHKHTSTYINTAFQKGKKNFKSYSEKKIFQYKISMYLNKLL